MPTGMVIDVIRTLISDPDCEPDGALVERFVAARDPVAFAELVRRHGPAVFGVCRRVLGHAQDAEDAFQAVWLVLARRAADVRPPGAVGPWLYGVAVRTATKARSLAMKRRQRQLAAAKPEAVEDAPAADLGPVLDEELAKLPERYRRAVVVCDLNGRSRSQAARDLGWPEGTVAARVAKGRELLAARLRRRGVTLSTAALAAVAVEVPPSLAANAVAAALEFASGAASASAPPVSQLLAEGVMRAMSVSRWKLPAVVLLAAGLAAGEGVAVVAGGGGPSDPPGSGKAPTAVAAPVAKPAAAVWREQPMPFDAGNPFRGKAPFHGIAFAPDGSAFAVARGDGQVILYDAKTLKGKWGYRASEKTANGLSFSPDGTMLAIGTPDGLRVHTDARPHNGLDTVKGTAVAFSPDGKRLAVSDGATTRVITVAARNGVVEVVPGEVSMTGPPGVEKLAQPLPAGVAWSPDGKRLALIRHEKLDGKYVAVVWGAGSGVPMALLGGHKDLVRAVAWSADGKYLATADSTEIVVWDGETFKELRRLGVLSGYPLGLAFSPDGKTLAAGVTVPDTDAVLLRKPGGRVQLWDVATGKWLALLGEYPADAVISLAFSPDGKTLATAWAGKSDGKPAGGLRVWRRTAGK
jgi:RNA polymerase sigma factor (sigma-70 family)